MRFLIYLTYSTILLNDFFKVQTVKVNFFALLSK